SKSEVKQLLASFDKSLPSARRAYAIVRCLADLGLRASEVVHITLDDIDWQAGTLRIAKGKCRRTDILPLPFETGRAIAEYLRTERPTTANRAVFVRHVAPFDVPIGSEWSMPRSRRHTVDVVGHIPGLTSFGIALPANF